MGMTEQQRVGRLSATREAAAAALEDLRHMRDVLDKPTQDRGEVRRLSAVLRRLLLDGDLGAIAAPRVGRLTIRAPDNNPIYRAERLGPYSFFASVGAVIMGVWVRAAVVDRGPRARDLPGFDPDASVELNLDSFLSQRVLCIEGRWISRKAVIKYAANIGSGVHSGTPMDDEEKAVARVRHSGAYSVVGDTVTITFMPDALSASDSEFSYSPANLDPVLAELIATARFLTTSPVIEELERVIKSEFGISAEAV